jgi:hypothetical protein
MSDSELASFCKISKANGMGDKIVLMWPMVLTHKITKSSPFWNIQPADLSSEKYEIIIYAEGTIESTGELQNYFVTHAVSLKL